MVSSDSIASTSTGKETKPHYLVSTILSQKSYPARFKMLRELSEYVDRHVVVTRETDDNPPSHPNMELCQPEGDLSGLPYWWWCSGVISELVESSHQPWLLHEHCHALTTALLKFRRHAPSKTFVSVYSSELYCLLYQLWLADPYRGALSPEQHLFYIGKFLKQGIINVSSWLFSDIFTGNSRQVENNIRMLRRNAQVHVLPTCVERDYFQRELENYPERTWTTQGLKLLFVGGFRTFKGVGLLLHTFQRFLKRGYEGGLFMIGGGFEVDIPWVKRLLKQHDLDEHVTLIDRIPRETLRYYYQHADALVFPSFVEGSPRVVKEAMASMCPVIAQDIPGTRILDPKGESIAFFDQGHSDGLLQHLEHFYQSPGIREQRAKRGYQRVRHLSPKAVAARFARLYECHWPSCHD